MRSRYELGREGFTLIELLMVVAIIGLLSSIVIGGVSSSRKLARDAKRKSDMRQLRIAAEAYLERGTLPTSAGWFSNAGHGGLDAALTPTFIQQIPDDPISPGANYMYWRKDFVGYTCLTGGEPYRYAFYARLENPSAQDLATIADPFDTCVASTWGMNYKVGN